MPRDHYHVVLHDSVVHLLILIRVVVNLYKKEINGRSGVYCLRD